MKRIDFHTHSTASDGTFTPSELAHHAASNALAALALTDHDCVDGTEEFLSECNKVGIEGIPGVELSAKFSSELHIVGLFVDYKNSDFRKKLDDLKNSRGIRNKKMIELLQSHGFNVTVEDVLRQKSGATLNNTGKPHIVAAILENGCDIEKQAIYDNYISKGKPCHVSRLAYTPEECIDLIHSVGGLAVFAHPLTVSTDKAVLSELLERLKKAGLDGMECYYYEHTPDFRRLCIELCGQFGLLVSGGSDFHGKNKDNPIGRGGADIDIPYSLLEDMKKRKGLI